MGRVKRVVMIASVAAILLSMGSCTWFLSMFNTFKVGGESYSLDKMRIAVDGPFEGVYGVFVIMTSGDLDITESTFFTGEGNIVFLALISSSDGIAEDDYVWDPDYSVPAAGLLQEGWAAANLIGETESADAVYWFTDGSLSVRRTLGGAFHLEGDLKGEDDLTSDLVDITLSYRGKVDEELAPELFASMCQH